MIMLSKHIKKYPWLSITTTLEKYIAPDYYDRILKKYIFNGKHDLDLLREFIPRLRIVEFGSGTGRATEIVIGAISNIKQLTVVDLSDRMLTRCRERFADKKFIEYVNSDTIEFMNSTDAIYDFAYSLWSFSHSVHQNLKRHGMKEGSKKIGCAITKFITENIKSGGSFFLIHFDSLSQEQRISIKQRRKDNFVFANNDKQCPSKLLIDKVLNRLKRQGKIELSIDHYTGAQLEFVSLDEALEYYLNFHMESHFNKSTLRDEIIEELTKDLEKLKDSDGTIRIKPGCFIYKIFRK